MSTNNKKNTASMALLEMDSIMKSIKNESKDTMKALLSEAVKDALRDSVDGEDDESDENDDEYEVVDGQESAEKDTENTKDVDGEANDSQEDEDDEEDGSWDDFEKYKVGDDTYDLTGVEDSDTVVKVYKLLKDDDQVVIKKDGDKVELKDNETGAEYVIDLGDGDLEVSKDEEEPIEDGAEDNEVEQLSEGIFEFGEEGDGEIAGLPSEPSEPEGEEETFDLSNEPDGNWPVNLSGDGTLSDEDIEELVNNLGENESGKYTANGESSGLEGKNTEGMQFENKRNKKKTMKESKEVLFEIDLGYTDNYQKKDPIGGLSNSEPSKSGKSWHKGVPTGTEKPWAGSTNGKGNPFAKEVNEEFDECGNGLCEEDLAGFDSELEEATNVGGAVQQRSNSKSKIPAGRKENGPFNKRHVTTGSDYNEMVSEMKKLKKENKALQEAVVELRNGMKEAYLTNVNLGKITKLFLENTTTKAEKIDIINRFTNEAKTVEQSKTLFESISKQLKKAPQMSQITENNAGKTMEGSKMINESKTQTKDVLEVIDFMNRMANC